MNRNRLLQLLFLVLAIAAIALAGTFHKPLGELRTEMDLESGEEITDSFANIKLIQAMPGIFRVLLIDYLWIQIEQMKQDGYFYDAEQKTAMICALQPRFPHVWGNRAWNLAYNISVQAYTPWERWRWVSSGIELLRDKGIVYNPKSLYLYMELAQTYFQKLGSLSDDMHVAYWSFHAAEFHRVLGSPPRNSDAEFYRDWMAAIAEAPQSVEELRKDSDTAKFLDSLARYDIKPGMAMLDNYNRYSNDQLVRMLDQPLPPASTERDKSLHELMASDKYKAARAAVVAFSRSMVLRETYKMKPFWMLEITNKYGPMDWRLVWTHSLYWSSYGLEHCKNQDVRYDKLTTSRFILFSLNFLISYNRATLVYNSVNPEQPEVRTQTDWRMIDSCNQTYKELGAFIEGSDSESVKAGGTASTYMSSHENFLKLAIQSFYCAGQIDKAEEYFAYAKKHYTWKNARLYDLPMERFVFETLNSNGISNRQMMANFVSAFLQNGYMSIAMGYDDNFALCLDRAQMFWKLWDDKVKGDPSKALPPLESIQTGIALETLGSVPLESAMSIWEFIPTEGQLASYDQLLAVYTEKCEQRGIDIKKAFPEPPGIEQYRKLRQQYIEEMNRRRGEKPEG